MAQILEPVVWGCKVCYIFLIIYFFWFTITWNELCRTMNLNFNFISRYFDLILPIRIRYVHPPDVFPITHPKPFTRSTTSKITSVCAKKHSLWLVLLTSYSKDSQRKRNSVCVAKKWTGVSNTQVDQRWQLTKIGMKISNQTHLWTFRTARRNHKQTGPKRTKVEKE